MNRLMIPCLLFAAAVAHAQDAELVVYANKGQTTEQQAKDRADCARVAAEVAEAQPGMAIEPAPQLVSAIPDWTSIDRASQHAAAMRQARFVQARALCMQDRGYVVR